MKKLLILLSFILLLSACNKGDFNGSRWGDQEKNVLKTVGKHDYEKESIADEVYDSEYDELSFENLEHLGYIANIDYLFYTQIQSKFLGNSAEDRHSNKLMHFKEPTLLEINIKFDNDYDKKDIYNKLLNLYGTPNKDELNENISRWQSERFEIFYDGDDYLSYKANEDLAKDFAE